jgi:serine/threonine protein kinase/tetratricopeptide (TPR) repeat protein
MNEPTPSLQTENDELLASLADDFLRRYRAGENPALEEYVERRPDLACQIRDLLSAALAMEQPGAGLTFDFTPEKERVGAMIGRYKLLQRIGEGGFGVVYMAEQQHPIQRKVALKVIKPGFDTKQVIARFEAERQALALMDHENIAKVLDAGATDSGRPYFVMELVHGLPITQFCDENELPPRERLELFVLVCRAVQHAHTKGIIHRDLKPTNVLVTLQDGVPVPKVIDFGVAKATGQQLTEKTLFTHFAQMVGTPLYMSPEQAEMTSVDVDTRSDVYSLGVLLYELLTGTTPLDKERLKRSAFDEVRRLIREEEPPRPSTRLSTLGDQAKTISARRKCDPPQLGRLMRGELDWIVMKALEKDRRLRYETATGLALDIERYLRDDPVEACPPSAGYRLRKLVRRYRLPIGMAAVFLVMLTLASIVSIWQAIRATRAERQVVQQRDQVEAALRQQEHALREAEAQRQRAEENFRQARIAVNDLVLWPALGREGQLPDPVRNKLVEVAIKYYTSLGDASSTDPSMQYDAAIGQRTLGFLLKGTGDLRGSEELLRRSISTLEALHREHPGRPEYPQQLGWSRYMFCETLSRQGHSEEAQVAAEQARKVYEALMAEHPESTVYRGEAWWVYSWLVRQHVKVGRMDDAAEMYARRLAIKPTEHWDWYEGAGLYLIAGDVGRYRSACREMLERFGKQAEENLEIADRTAKTCALLPDSITDLSQVERLAKRTVTGTEKHPGYDWFVLTMALIDYRRARYDRVLAALQEQPLKDDGPAPHASALAIQAMAQHRLGLADQARDFLASARSIIATTPRDQRSGNLIDWLHCEILCREAEQVLAK